MFLTWRAAEGETDSRRYTNNKVPDIKPDHILANRAGQAKLCALSSAMEKDVEEEFGGAKYYLPVRDSRGRVLIFLFIAGASSRKTIFPA